MPPIALAGAFATGYWAWAAKAAIVLYGVYQANRQRKQAARAYEASLRDRKITIRSSEAPRAVLYGETVTSGVLAYVQTSGEKSEFLHLVVVLAAHECDAITDVLFDGESIGTIIGDGIGGDGFATGAKVNRQVIKPATQVATAAGAGSVIELDHEPHRVLSVVYVARETAATQTSSLAGEGGGGWSENELLESSIAVHMREGVDYIVNGNKDIQFIGAGQTGERVTVSYQYDAGHPLVKVRKFLGSAAGERDTDLEALPGSKWTANHLGKGVCRLHLRIEFDETAFGGRMPNVSAIVRGKKLFDPRTSTTVWSANPALVLRDYLTSSAGFGCTADEIDDAAVIAAANVCDEAVQIAAGQTQTRYRCDGVVFADASPRENLEALLTSCVGSCVYSAGKWRILPAAYRAPVADLDDDDLADGDIVTKARAPYASLFNAVRGQFVDAARKYALNDFAPYVSTPYVTEDNGETLFRDFDFPFCQDPIRAQRMAKLVLFQSRQAIVETAPYKLRALALQPGDTVRITRAHDGWTNKVFRITGRAFDAQSARVVLTYREEAEAIYAEDFNEWVTPDPAANTLLPDPSYVAPIEFLAVATSAATYDVTPDGTIRPYARVTWLAVTGADVLRGGRIEVLWKRTTDPSWHEVRLQPDATEMRIEPAHRSDVYLIQVSAVNGIGVRSAPATITHEASDDLLPAGKVVPGSNLIASSAFAYDTEGWWSQIGNAISPTPTPIESRQPADYILSFRKARGTDAVQGAPSNAIWNITEQLQRRGRPVSATGYCQLFSPSFAIDSTRNLLMQASITGFYAEVEMFVAVYAPDGRGIGTLRGFSRTASGQFVALSRSLARFAGNVRFGDPSSYVTRAWVIDKERLQPSEQSHGKGIFGRLVFEARPNVTFGFIGASAVGIMRPMVASTELPGGLAPTNPVPWQVGAEDIISPARLQGGIEGFTAYTASSLSLPATIPQNGALRPCTVRVQDADGPNTVEVTIVIDAEVFKAATNPSRVEVALFVETATQQFLYDPQVVVEAGNIGGGESVRKLTTITRTLNDLGGEAVVYLNVTRVVAQNATLHAATLSARVVKR